jgi:hypothetical protein
MRTYALVEAWPHARVHAHKTAEVAARDRSAGWAVAIALGLGLAVLLAWAMRRLSRKIAEERADRALDERFRELEDLTPKRRRDVVAARR